MRKRVMVLCLDAFDAALSNRLIEAGMLPGLARLKAESARFELEHGPGGKARFTGLTWEHFSSGRKPATSGRWSVISFDAKTFCVRQSYATERPFLADVDAKCVIFDVPYFDLQSMPNAVGVVGWAGHDTGVRRYAVPMELMAEIISKFGPPPDTEALNVMVYPSVELTARMGANLRASVKRRVDIAEWLFGERYSDWDVAVLGFVEPHDAIELLYHGIDPDHHLAHLPSVEPARQGLLGVYEEISAQIERLMARFPDVTFVTFTMHGMGENEADLPAMLLLPELMYRMAFGRPLFCSRADWRAARSPVLKEGEDWNSVVISAMAHTRSVSLKELSSRAVHKARRTAIKVARGALGETLARNLAGSQAPGRDKTFDVDWMPASHYARYWPQMEAFALPSFFEGRVRVNLRGREKYGCVPLNRYAASLDLVEDALRACVDIKTGAPVVREIVRSGKNDPMNISDTQADLAILWNRSSIGFRHPIYGDIGPAPVRRPGGHSGGHGALYVRSKDILPGDHGLRSSFDVAPTVVDLMGTACRSQIDGESLLPLMKSAGQPLTEAAPAAKVTGRKGRNARA